MPLLPLLRPSTQPMGLVVDPTLVHSLQMLERHVAAESTRKNYAARLRTIVSRVGASAPSLREVLRDPAKHYPAFRVAYPVVATRKNVITAILVLFRIDPDLADPAGLEARAFWKARLDQARAILATELAKNRPSPRQEHNYTGLDEVREAWLRMRDDPNAHSTHAGSQRLVLLSFYAHQHPKRADLGAVTVLRDEPTAASAVGAGNYVVLPPANARRRPYLVLNVYKTSATYGRLEEDLASPFVRDLGTSLRRHPRPYVFATSAGRAMTNNAFGKFVVRTFEATFGRATGTSLLRHAFIRERVDLTAPLESLDEHARLMGHAVMQQRQYYWRHVDGHPLVPLPSVGR